LIFVIFPKVLQLSRIRLTFLNTFLFGLDGQLLSSTFIISILIIYARATTTTTIDRSNPLP
jgi:hypothetical protein